jgi:hypothetical protein
MGEDILVAEQARRRGEALVASGGLAVRASYVSRTGLLRIVLSSGVRVEIPAALIEGLAAAAEADRARIEIDGIGHGLHWPDLDLDLSVPELLAGVFGTRRWMDSQRAARAGASTSAAKAEAARRNGTKGGRPRKTVA